MKRAYTLLTFTFLLLFATAAWGDNASKAFNEGKRLFGKAKFAESCAEFKKAENAAGANVKTRYWTGRCNEEQNKKAAAYLAYKDAKRMAVKAGDTKRAEVIELRIAELGQVLPFLVLTVPEELRNIDGLTVTRDGEDVPAALWDHPLPVDIGKHRITVSAPGYQEVTLNVTATEPGSKAQLVIPPLAKVAGEPMPVPEPGGDTPPPTPNPDGSADAPEMERKNGGLFWTGVGLVSAGGLAVVVGGVMVALSAASDSATGIACDEDGCFDTTEEDSGGAAPGVGLLITGVVFLGVGIPFMVVFGKKVPAEKEGEEQGFTIEPVFSPTGFHLRGTF